MTPLARLIKESPDFHHGTREKSPRGYALQNDALEWIEREINGGASVETGSGWSSVLLAHYAARHLVIDPLAEKAQRIKDYLQQHDPGALSRISWEIASSHEVVPRIKDEFDFILIDGLHAFPLPFIDWYYLVQSLKVNGYVMVDDRNLWTGMVLHTFMCEQPGWKQVWKGRNTTVFRLLEAFRPQDWHGIQPYVMARSQKHQNA